MFHILQTILSEVNFSTFKLCVLVYRAIETQWQYIFYIITFKCLCATVCPDKIPGLQPWTPGHNEAHRVTIGYGRKVILTSSATVHSIEILNGGRLSLIKPVYKQNLTKVWDAEWHDRESWSQFILNENLWNGKMQHAHWLKILGWLSVFREACDSRYHPTHFAASEAHPHWEQGRTSHWQSRLSLQRQPHHFSLWQVRTERENLF